MEGLSNLTLLETNVEKCMNLTNFSFTVSRRKHPLTNSMLADKDNESQNGEGLL